MNEINILKKLGFTENEAKVYLILNDYGPNKAGEIAKIAKIDRSSLYNTLRILIQKGFVSSIMIGRVQQFQSTGPKILLDYIKEQENSIKKIIPELHKRHKASKVEGQVRHFKGIRGIKSIFLDIIRTKKTQYVLATENQFRKNMPEFAKQFHRMKKEYKIKAKILIKEGQRDLQDKNTEYRFLPKSIESPANTTIYGKKVAIIIWSKIPEGIIIENSNVARSYKSYFNLLWEKSKKF